MEQRRRNDASIARQARPTSRPVARRGWEPPLADMLADPVVIAMMAVDGVRPTDIVILLSEAKERLGARPR